MRRYFTFLRPHSGFSSHFCNTHFRDTWFSSLPLFSNYSTGFRICESSKYHSKQFFYSSFTLFSKIRKLTVFSRNPRTPIIPQSVRLRMDADGSFVPKKRLSCRCPAARPVRPAHAVRNFPETKKIICPAHAAHVGHMMGIWFNLSPANSFHRCGGPPPSRREVWGVRFLSKPFIQLRVQGRNPARFKGGYGVPRGFKGEKSKSPPNPLGLAERRSLLPPLRRSPSLEAGGLGAAPVKASGLAVD